MSAVEIIFLVAFVYLFIGALCAAFAAATQDGVRLMLFAFVCWPVIAYYGLLLLLGRAQ
jgi:hypothetical protein